MLQVLICAQYCRFSCVLRINVLSSCIYLTPNSYVKKPVSIRLSQLCSKRTRRLSLLPIFFSHNSILSRIKCQLGCDVGSSHRPDLIQYDNNARSTYLCKDVQRSFWSTARAEIILGWCIVHEDDV